MDINIDKIRELNEELRQKIIGFIVTKLEDRLQNSDKEVSMILAEPDDTKRKGYVDSQRAVFKKILNSMSWLATENIHVDIRFDSKNNVIYYPAFVTSVKDKLSDAEKISFIKELFRATANPEKMSINQRLYSLPRSLPCMRNDPQAFSVDVYGRIYNCEHLVGRKDKALGTLKRLRKKITRRSLMNHCARNARTAFSCLSVRAVVRQICARATRLA